MNKQTNLMSWNTFCECCKTYSFTVGKTFFNHKNPTTRVALDKSDPGHLCVTNDTADIILDCYASIEVYGSDEVACDESSFDVPLLPVNPDGSVKVFDGQYSLCRVRFFEEIEDIVVYDGKNVLRPTRFFKAIK